MTTPEPVLPAPDTWDLRHRLAARLARLDAEQWGGDHDFAPYGKDRESDSVVDAAAEVFEAVQAEREAGLRADLDQALRERDEAQRQEAAWRASAQESDKGLTLYAREVRRLRAELAGARTIPDDAAERLTYALFRMAPGPFRNAPAAPVHALMAPLWKHTWRDLSDEERAEWLEYGRGVLDQLGLSTPTTDPAPEAADVQWGVQRADGVLDQMDDEDDARQHLHWFDPGTAHVVSRTVVYSPWTPAPAAPQAPAEPTAHVMLCPTCGTYTAGVSGETCVNDGTVLRPTEPMASCGYHTEAEAQRSIRHELCTPAAREDAATPPLPLHEQADLLTWRVVHVPPGTTDREDTDTPITPGWWLVGHGDDPDHPDVQVHLGDRLPTSSAATPAGGSHEVEVTVQDDGWATAECRTCTASIGESAEDTVQDWADRHRADTLRPGSLTPIQPEEA